MFLHSYLSHHTYDFANEVKVKEPFYRCTNASRIQKVSGHQQNTYKNYLVLGSPHISEISAYFFNVILPYAINIPTAF